MKKIALLSVAAVAMATTAFAADEMKAPAAAPAPAAVAPAAGAPMTAPAMTAAKKVELKDGSWAMVGTDGSVKVSKDGGKTWTAAPDGTWEAKDGSKITTKGGHKA